ncbi:MAG: PilZ domain-containing protein [Acidobacteria bacterium]|nr:PilZ domain-containing protein [Acidobacteriota bacterium]
MPTESNLRPGVNRIVPRYPFEARFKIEIERPQGPLAAEGWARDISESGIGAFVALPLEMGETATLRIPLEKGVELVVPAQITRILGTQYGFQFLALSARQRDQILHAVVGKKAVAYQTAVV